VCWNCVEYVFSVRLVLSVLIALSALIGVKCVECVSRVLFVYCVESIC